MIDEFEKYDLTSKVGDYQPTEKTMSKFGTLNWGDFIRGY